jgi:hypothetical protein
MMVDEPAPAATQAVDRGDETPVVASTSEKSVRIVRAVQVRLRFIVVLGVAFVVVGLWGQLRNVWDTHWHRLVGSHAARQSVSIDTEFFCPMCPGVISDWPAICPVCSMDLIRRKKGDAPILPEGVVARMQLSPYRIQLAGIVTTVVETRPLARDISVAGRLIELPSPGLRSGELNDAADSSPPQIQLSLDCSVSGSDLAALSNGCEALIVLEEVGDAATLKGRVEFSETPAKGPGPGRKAVIRIRISDAPAWAHAGMYATARVAVPLAKLEPFASLRKTAQPEFTDGFPAIPESAVVDTGSRRVVFVETMAGMFDGVEVTLGPRCGDYYPVIKGLTAGQRVASVGAFLIDAEARLSPDLAAAYFGAARTAAPGAASEGAPSTAAKPPTAKRSKKSGLAKLSAADEQLAKQQKICPVTQADLDSMGGPIPVDVAGRRVFICCKGCEKPLKADPEKYLAKLKHDQSPP